MNEKYTSMLGRPGVSVKECADALGMSTRAVYRAVARGDLQAARVGRRVVISSDGIRRLLGLADGS